MAQGYAFCSGTLIAPSAVLTAGHCIEPLGQLQYLVAFGQDASQPTALSHVTQQLTHPMYTAERAPYDFGLYQLASPVSDVAPVPLNAVPIDASFVGQSVRHVGFGISDETAGTGGGIKRTVTYPITQVSGMLVYSGAPGQQTCTGDSGGPGLIAIDGGPEALALVVSAGPNCHTDGWDDRVDEVVSWIQDTSAPWDAVDAGTGPAHHGGCGEAGDGGAALAAFGLLVLGVRRRS